MVKYIFIILLITQNNLLIFSQQANDKDNIAVEDQRGMIRNNIKYPFTVKGVRMLVDDLINNNEQHLYTELNPLVFMLESKVFISNFCLIFSSMIGVGTTTIGLFVLMGAYGESSNNIYVSSILFTGGLSLIGLGIILYFIFYPNDSDIIKFIGRHNDISKEYKITVVFRDYSYFINVAFRL